MTSNDENDSLKKLFALLLYTEHYIQYDFN